MKRQSEITLLGIKKNTELYTSILATYHCAGNLSQPHKNESHIKDLIMIDKLNEDLCVNEHYRVRAHGPQKEAFYGYVKGYLYERGYDGRADGGFQDKKGAVNLVFGNETDADIFLTAHYDTPKNSATLPSFFVTNTAGIFADVIMGLLYIFIAFGVTALIGIFAGWYYAAAYFVLGLTWAASNFARDNKFNFNDNTSGCIALMEIADKIANECPEIKDKLCFVFFDKEETGAQGSKKLKKRLSASLSPEIYRSKIFLNFDCVGGRDKDLNIYVYTDDGIKLAEEIKKYAPGQKEITVFKTSLLPTDANNFKDARAMTFISTSKRLFYPLSKLKDAHTKNDRYLDGNMIGYYTQTVVSYIKGTKTGGQTGA
ncbi:MAG: M28 family peptidase [Clostridiales bacterium]|jgi:hypothetical protein|nr:M28 family peptidase [Clostridiales bacterium]